MLHGLRILVTARDDATALQLRELFERRHADVRHATDGKGALAHVRPTWVPHVLVTEFRLGDMDANDLARAVGRHAGAPVAVICTAPRGRQRHTHPAGLGFARCFVHPVEAEEICAAIAEAIDTERR